MHLKLCYCYYKTMYNYFYFCVIVISAIHNSNYKNNENSNNILQNEQHYTQQHYTQQHNALQIVLLLL